MWTYSRRIVHLPFGIARSSERITGYFHEKAGLCQAIFWVVSTVHQTADQREAHLTFSLSFIGRFFLRPSIQPIAGQREARNAAIPNSPITDSPYFHPHSWWSDCSGASWVSSMGNGCCRLVPELKHLRFQKRSLLADAAVTRTRRFALCPVKRQSSSVPAAGCDSVMARTLQRLPTSDAAGSLIFAPPLPPLSSCHACRHVSPGAGPIAVNRYPVPGG